MREAMAGSTGGMQPKPYCAGSRMAAKARALEEGRGRALASFQQRCSSFKYSSEGGTEKGAVAGLRLKKALGWAKSA